MKHLKMYWSNRQYYRWQQMEFLSLTADPWHTPAGEYEEGKQDWISREQMAQSQGKKPMKYDQKNRFLSHIQDDPFLTSAKSFNLSALQWSLLCKFQLRY